MKKVLIFIALGLSQLSIAQKDTVKYEMISDAPNYTYWGAGASYTLSIDRFNFPLVGFGIDGVFMHENFSANFHSNLSLFEHLTDFSFNGHPDHESIYEPEKSRDIGFNASYFFINNVKTVTQAVKLKQSGNVISITHIPAKTSFRIGADIGFSTGVTYYNFGDAMLNGIDNSGNTAILESRDENAAVSTMFNQHILRLGGTRTKTTKFKINTDMVGVRVVQDYTRIYGHVLVGLGQKMDNIFYLTPDILGNEIYTEYDITTDAPMLPVGLAVGYEYYIMKPNKLGVSWIGELGLMPGPKYALQNNVYLQFRIRIHYGQFL